MKPVRAAPAPRAWTCRYPGTRHGCDTETYTSTVVRCYRCSRVFRWCRLPCTQRLFRQAPYFSAPGPRRPYVKDPFKW